MKVWGPGGKNPRGKAEIRGRKLSQNWKRAHRNSRQKERQTCFQVTCLQGARKPMSQQKRDGTCERQGHRGTKSGVEDSAFRIWVILSQSNSRLSEPLKCRQHQGGTGRNAETA